MTGFEQTGFELLTVAQTRALDARAAALGVPTRTLMEHAGRAVAATALARFGTRDAVVLAGPGANGGDGFVAARALAEAGARVRVALLGARSALRGDAADAAAAWTGPVEPLAPDCVRAGDTVIDAVFGAGLSRPLEGAVAALAQASPAWDVIAVDVPSGLPGDGEAPQGPAFQAKATVTFVRKKPAHVLQPGRALCGAVVVADIGAPAAALEALGVVAWENDPLLWRAALPQPGPNAHKHSRGRVAIVFGGEDPGATVAFGAQRLAAGAAQRSGAGWVSAIVPPAAQPWLAAESAALVVRAAQGPQQAAALAAAHHAIVFGPAAGTGPHAQALLDALAAAGPPLVLDADALTLLAARRIALPAGAILTPHAGEFARLAPEAAHGSKLERARAAARALGAVVLFKGPDTVIAEPGGRAIVNTHATPHLASAGTGDVLAGLIGGLRAQGMPPLEAAAAAAWIHGEAGRRAGRGLIADDLPGLLPAVLRDLCAD